MYLFIVYLLITSLVGVFLRSHYNVDASTSPLNAYMMNGSSVTPRQHCTDDNCRDIRVAELSQTLRPAYMRLVFRPKEACTNLSIDLWINDFTGSHQYASFPVDNSCVFYLNDANLTYNLTAEQQERLIF